jgi:hypothetical protein
MAQDAFRMSKGSPQDAPIMAQGLLRMDKDGPRIAQDAPRMSQGLHQDAPRMATGFLGLLRMA